VLLRTADWLLTAAVIFTICESVQATSFVQQASNGWTPILLILSQTMYKNVVFLQTTEFLQKCTFLWLQSKQFCDCPTHIILVALVSMTTFRNSFVEMFVRPLQNI
jgi:hypothetical protein